MSYGLRGYDGQVYGLGVFNPPARPNWIDPGYPPDPGIVALNTANSDAYLAAVQQEQAGNNFDQCAQNAQNANSEAQYAEVMARCQQQAEIQGAPVVLYTAPAAPARTITPQGGPTPTPAAPWSPPPVAQRPAALVPAESGTVPALPGAAPFTLPTVGGFDLSKIPWWGWLAAGGAALFMFGGNRGR